MAVAEVILNRTASPRFPNTICGVVNQPNQFSYSHNLPITNPTAFNQAIEIATHARLNLLVHQLPHSALHYYNPTKTRTTPPWARHPTKQLKIGNHLFPIFGARQ